MVIEFVNIEAEYFFLSYIILLFLSQTRQSWVLDLINVVIKCSLSHTSELQNILFFLCAWIVNVKGLNDTITSCISHYCFRVIVFPRISSRSTHCVITPSDQRSEHCTEMFPIQTGKIRSKICVTDVYFSKPFQLCFQSVNFMIVSWLYEPNTH